MYKTELIKRVAKDTRLSQRIVADVLTATLDEITLGLKKKETVTIPGFGTFYTRIRPESQARSFKTNRTITVPPMTIASFRVGELLKKAVRRIK